MGVPGRQRAPNTHIRHYGMHKLNVLSQIVYHRDRLLASKWDHRADQELTQTGSALICLVTTSSSDYLMVPT